MEGCASVGVIDQCLAGGSAELQKAAVYGWLGGRASASVEDPQPRAKLYNELSGSVYERRSRMHVDEAPAQKSETHAARQLDSEI